MPEDAWKNYHPTISDLGRDCVALTASDTTVLDPVPKAVVALTTGNLVVRPLAAEEAGQDRWVTFTAVPVGFVVPCRVTRVGASSTATAARID